MELAMEFSGVQVSDKLLQLARLANVVEEISGKEVHMTEAVDGQNWQVAFALQVSMRRTEELADRA